MDDNTGTKDFNKSTANILTLNIIIRRSNYLLKKLLKEINTLYQLIDIWQLKILLK